MKPILFNTEMVKAIQQTIDKMVEGHKSGYDQLYEAIIYHSDKEFADKVINIVRSEYNTYDLITMYSRMRNIIDLLAYGVCKNDVKKLIETQTDDIAIKLIRGGF